MTCLPEGIARHLHVRYIKLLLNFLLQKSVITGFLIAECFTTEFEFAFSSIKYA